MHQYVNFGDVSPQHGQTWIRFGGDDYADCVSILSGSDIGLADNQYMIEQGSIYFNPRNFNSALDTIGRDIIGPPEYLELAYAYWAYSGMDHDTWGGFAIVQVGKRADDWTASGTTCDSPDVVLHGNASIRRYLEREYLAA